MQADFSITTDPEFFNASNDHVRINYLGHPAQCDCISIGNCGILFENDIKQQPVECFTTHHYTAFFKTANADLDFDILGASFYLISRYEEYLPHQKDSYGRFSHEASLAFQQKFLKQPLVNIWVNYLATIISSKFPAFTPACLAVKNKADFLPTYDIDIAYAYNYKGLLRNLGGFVKAPSLQRLAVLAGKGPDPFNCYTWLHKLHNKYQLPACYFFLVAEKNSRYDKNILPHKDALWKLVHKHAGHYKVGIHPSWQSVDRHHLLASEKEQLESMAEKTVTSSRQHYIRFNLPGGYQRLDDAGITDDYSMGYGSINGFRASVASSFYWYDLQQERATGLLIHPFCFMEANSFYEQHFTPQQALSEMHYYYETCKAVNGRLITIWHNHFLGTYPLYVGWRQTYEQFLETIHP